VPMVQGCTWGGGCTRGKRRSDEATKGAEGTKGRRHRGTKGRAESGARVVRALGCDVRVGRLKMGLLMGCDP
jgi:hypothetical protein